MSEHDVSSAAATGAAAAVDAVQDQQAETERAASMEAATAEAAIRVDEAAERAELAAEAATEATQAATQASEHAASASATAEAATEASQATRSDLAEMQRKIDENIAGLRLHLDERFGQRPASDEPTEVVVTHDAGTDNAPSERSDTGGNASPRDTGPERIRRHRFGSRR